MTASDRDALIDERELAAALRGLRPDPAAFRAAVERRLRARALAPEPDVSGARPDAEEVHAADGAWWRRAAGWLPAELVPGSLAAGGAKLSWKALPGLIALPALSFAMLAAPVVLALGTFGQESGERAQERLEVVRAWWRAHRRAALVTLAAIGVLFLRAPAGAGTALLLVSTGVLALLLGRLSAAGFGRRAEVGRHCAGLLAALAVWMATLDAPWRALFPDERSAKLGFVLIAAGAIACAAVALRAGHATVWHLLTRVRGADAVLLLYVALLAPWALLVGWGALAHATGTTHLARFVAQSRPYDRMGWELAQRSLVWLRREGIEPELAGLRAHWRERRAAAHDASEGLIVAGVDLGFVEADELAALTTEGRALLHDRGPIQGASLRERADLLALTRTPLLLEDERDRLAERLLDSAIPGEERWALARLATVAASLDALGRRERADGLRSRAHALLRESWVPPGRSIGSVRGEFGFCAPGTPASAFVHVSDTHDAVDLMLRFGVPEEVELEAVVRGLERSARTLFPWNERWPLQWEAVLALSKVERGLLPETAPLAWLGANKVLLAMALLAAFSVLATVRAPIVPDP